MLKGGVKGIIVAPPSVRVSYKDKFALLFNGISRITGFPIQWTAGPTIPKGCEVVLAYGTPLKQLTGLSKSIKLISMVCDVHTKDPKVRAIKHALWRRADSIWTFEDENFKRGYLRWYHKHVWIPMYFATHERYTSIPYRDRPKRKCLLSGCSHLPWYPLRNYIAHHGSDKYIEKSIGRPSDKNSNGGWKYIKDSYAKWLNSYFCCVTGTGNDTMHAKCLEIPAAGSLLLTNMVPDMAKAGFIPKVHYLPITKKTALSRITQCVKNPEKFEPIRKEGMKLVKRRHSVRNREEQLVRVIERIINRENMGAVSCEWI